MAIDPLGAVNSGTFRPITVFAPEGSILNAVPPAPTGAFSEIRRRVSSVTLGALMQAIPHMLAGGTLRGNGESHLHRRLGSQKRRRLRLL